MFLFVFYVILGKFLKIVFVINKLVCWLFNDDNNYEVGMYILLYDWKLYN